MIKLSYSIVLYIFICRYLYTHSLTSYIYIYIYYVQCAQCPRILLVVLSLCAIAVHLFESSVQT